MRRYEIELDESVSCFFEEIAIIVQRPIGDILSDALLKQVELLSLKTQEPVGNNDEKL